MTNARLKLIKPADLSVQQKPLYEDMKNVIEKKFTGFQAMQSDGTLIGPWSPWLTYPNFGKPAWEGIKSLYVASVLPARVREVIVLTVGAKFHAAYQLYAHCLVAENKGLDDGAISAIIAGQRPAQLNEDELLGYDIALSLVNGGVLPDLIYHQAIQCFGEEGAAEIIFLIGNYCFISMMLNGFDVPVPKSQ